MERLITIDSFKIMDGPKAGNYHLFDTDQGKMSCFDVDVSKKLVETIDVGNVLVDVTVKGQYTTITKIVDRPQLVKPQDAFKEAKKPMNYTTMYVSYAKDIFTCLITQANENTETGGQIMDTAIKLVKQAKEAFE